VHETRTISYICIVVASALANKDDDRFSGRAVVCGSVGTVEKRVTVAFVDSYRTVVVVLMMSPAQCLNVQRVYPFGKGKSEGDKSMKQLVSSSVHLLIYVH
jgi:hypothetical protein